ncbi:MAG: hypothetical protein Q4A78_05945 [Peptostreptococcaceae bacterium]|nr:hypothetical protein [Peptostreptococcaceae bacterium]
MYQLLEDQVYDSREIAAKIESGTPFALREDMTKRTKRDDALAFKLAISVDALREAPRYIEEEELIDKLMNLADAKAKEALEKMKVGSVVWDSYAYRYDEVRHEILVVAALMGVSNARRKLPDLMKRLLSQV